MSVTPVLASRFEGARHVNAEALRKLGAEKTLTNGWTFPDGSKLVLMPSGVWRALAPMTNGKRKKR